MAPLKGDDWLHVGALISVAIGAGDAFFHLGGFSHDADLMFIVGGLAGLGLKIANGLAGAIREQVQSGPPAGPPAQPGGS